MKKILLIGLKDVKLAFRDRTALMIMLLAPFLLTLGLGFVTGRFSGGSSVGIDHIPVALVNQDQGQIGNALVESLESQYLNGLIAPKVMGDPGAARRAVDANQADAAVIIPAGLTDNILSTSGQTSAQSVIQIELYSNPTTPTEAGIVKAILSDLLSQVEVGPIADQVIATQLVSSGLISSKGAAAYAKTGLQQLSPSTGDSALSVKQTTESGMNVAFDPLALIAPGMALMFLMWSASYSGRVLLKERMQGTLPRLLVSPTTTRQVLAGKILGSFLTGLAQVGILILATTLLFRLKWGDPTAIVVLVLAAVIAAVSWGMLIAAIAKTPTQVLNVGGAMTLLFGMLGGSFFPLADAPGWFQTLSKITPNMWGLDGFTVLAMGGNLHDILTPVLALVAMGIVVFIMAARRFGHHGFAEQ